jgi:serine protease Do
MDQFNVPRPYGSGSGWVFDTDGHIITNNHVVEGADSISVRFSDGTERKATVVGVDTKTDVAVIKVEGGAVLHPASLAQDPVEQGDIVFAFGSPLRFEFSMSQGIVSAKGRQLRIVADGQGYENFIQTDAAINPGNSGGPLTNISGEVIGMNTAIASRTGQSNGIGFAIPVDMVNDVVKQIIKNGRVTRGYLGIVIEDLDPDKAASYDFKGKGVLVTEPVPDGPAAKAGILSEDIITKVDGQPVDKVEQLREFVAMHAPGSKFPIEVYRGGKTLVLEAVVVEQPLQMASVPNATTPEKAAPAEDNRMELLRKLGIENATTFTQDTADKYRTKWVPGVLIMGVRPDSVAASQGLMRYTLITHVFSTQVKTVDELLSAIAKADTSKGIRLRINEGGRVRVVLLKLP